MTDDELEQRLRRHYEGRLAGEVQNAPRFEVMLEVAERPDSRRRKAAVRAAWIVPVAAALAVVWLGVPWQSGSPFLPSQTQLLAELKSSTRWQAPSDRWLDAPETPSYAGLPQLGPRRGVLEPPPLP